MIRNASIGNLPSVAPWSVDPIASRRLVADASPGRSSCPAEQVMNGGCNPDITVLTRFLDARSLMRSRNRVRVLRWCRAPVGDRTRTQRHIRLSRRRGATGRRGRRSDMRMRAVAARRDLPALHGAGDFPIDDVIRALWQARVAHRVTRDGHAQLGEPGDLRCAQLSSSGPWTGRGVAELLDHLLADRIGILLENPGERTAVARWVEESSVRPTLRAARPRSSRERDRSRSDL